MSQYAKVNVKFGADISQFSTAIQNAARQMQRAGQQLQDVGKSMTMNLTAPIVALGAASLYAFGQIDALKRGLISFAGSAEAAETEFSKLRDVAKLPGIGLEEAVKGSINLQAIGMSADDARTAMMAFGNAIATVGGGRENFELAIRGFGQLQNASKPLQQDLYQIANQLPQVNKLMIEAFGTNRAEDLAAMGISGKQLADFLIQKLGELPKVTGGIKNSFENMGDSIKVTMSKVGEALEKNFNISDKLNALSTMLSNMADKFFSLNPTLQKTILSFVALVAAIGPLIFSIGVLVKLFPTLIAGWSVLKGAVIAARVAMLASTTLMATMPALFLGIVGAIGLAVISMNNWGKSASEATQKLKDQREEAKLLALERDKLANPDKYFKDSKRADLEFSLYGKPQVDGGYKGFQMGKGQDFEKGTKFRFAGDINNAKGKGGAKGGGVGNNRTIFDSLSMQTKALESNYIETQLIVNEGWDKINQAEYLGGEQFVKTSQNAWSKYAAAFSQFKTTISSMMQDFVQNVIVDFASAMGEALITDENPFENWGRNLLGSIGSFLKQMGGLFIAYGVNLLLFQKSLKSMNPYLAIAAGAALVAAGGAVTALSRKGLDKGGSSSSGSYGSSGSGGYGEDMTLTTRIDGRDLVLSGQRTTAIGRR